MRPSSPCASCRRRCWAQPARRSVVLDLGSGGDHAIERRLEQRPVGGTQPPVARLGGHPLPDRLEAGREMMCRIRTECRAEPLVGALVRKEAVADEIVLEQGRLPGQAAIEGQRHQHRRPPAALGQLVEPGRRSQIEQSGCRDARAVEHQRIQAGREIEGRKAHLALPSRAAPAGMRGLRPGQQVAVAIQAQPALRLRQARRQIAQIGAGAAAEIDHAGRRPQRLCEPVGQRAAPGGVIVRLAQRQPVVREPAQPPARSSSAENARTASAQPGRRSRSLVAPAQRRSRSAGSVMI